MPILKLNQVHLSIAIVLLALLFSSCSSSRKLSRNLEYHFAEAPVLKKEFAGFALYDPEKKKMIFQHNANKYFTPASNTKLFTFYTALKLLGDSIPAIQYSVHQDSLVFWGTGDPTFLHEDFPQSKIFDFLKNRKEKLFYAAPNYKETHFGPGWAWDDYNWYYSVERAAFPIYGNFINLHFNPTQKIPHAFPSIFQDSIKPIENDLSTRSTGYRELSNNQIFYAHQLGNNARNQIIPFKYSNKLLVKLLQDTLHKKVELLPEIPQSFKPGKTIYSISSDSLYYKMMQESDNFIAEQVLLMASAKLSDTLKTGIAIDFMEKNYLQDLPDEPQWVDGSGLSTYDLFTPRSIIKLLEKIRAEVPQEKLFSFLPTGGVSGTIKNLYKAEEPYVFAKTGTLSNTHNLSGYLKTKSGKVLLFSFMNENYVVSTSQVQQAMEQVLIYIHQNY